MGDLVTGRVAETGQSFAPGGQEEESTDGAPKTEYLVDMLRWRATSRPDDQLFSLLDTKVRVTIMYMYTCMYVCVCVQYKYKGNNVLFFMCF